MLVAVMVSQPTSPTERAVFRRIVIESAKLELEIWAFCRLEEFVDRHCVEGKDDPIQFWYETKK